MSNNYSFSHIIDSSKKTMQEIKSLFKSDYIITLISSGIHAVLTFAYGIFVRHYVSPFEYGRYLTAYLVFTYFNYLQLGGINAFNRDYPQAVGANNIEKMHLLKGTVLRYIYVLYSLSIFLLSFLAFVLYRIGIIEWELLIGFILMGFFSLITYLFLISSQILKSHGDFKRVAYSVIVSNVAFVVVGCIFVYFFRYYGMFIPLLLSPIIQIIINREALKNSRGYFSNEVLIFLIKTGFPLMLNGFVWTLIHTTDQFIILYFAKSETLGLYSIAQTMFSVMLLVPQTISQVLYIKMSNLYGKNEDDLVLIERTRDFSVILGIVCSLICVCSNYILPYMVKVLMPQYTDGIRAAQILSIGLAIYSASMLCGNFFSILRLNRQLISSSVVLCVSNVIFSSSLVVIFGFDICYVAIGSAISYLVYSFVLLIKIIRKYKLDVSKWLKEIYVPLFLILIPNLLAVNYFSNSINMFLFAIPYNLFILVLIILNFRKRALI